MPGVPATFSGLCRAKTCGLALHLIVESAIEAGFVICHLDEWGPSAKQIAAYPDLAEEAERPMLFLMSVRKPR